MKGNLAPESAVLKLSGKDIEGPFRGPVSFVLCLVFEQSS